MTSTIGTTAFGELLRRHRTRQGATQCQLADLSTVSVRAIRDLEAGRANRPRRDTVALIATGLGLRGPELDRFEAAARRSGPPPALTPLSPPSPPEGTTRRAAAPVRWIGAVGTDGHDLLLVLDGPDLAPEAAHRLLAALRLLCNGRAPLGRPGEPAPVAAAS